MRTIKLIYALIIGSILLGCNGDGSDENTDFGGVWDVIYNTTADSCGIVNEGDSGFTDVYTINQVGSAIELSAESELIVDGQGEIEGDDSFIAEEEVRGDIFGAGTFCEYIARTSFNNADENRAETLFTVNISCADGFSCDTRAIGEATKQTNP